MANPKIYTYSVLFSSSEEFKDKVPYVSAVLEMPDGSRLASLLAGYKPDMEICIGQEVKAVGQDQDGKTLYSL